MTRVSGTFPKRAVKRDVSMSDRRDNRRLTRRTSLLLGLLLTASLAHAQSPSTTTQYSSGGVLGFGGNVGYRESAASKAALGFIAGGGEWFAGIRTDGTLVNWGANAQGATIQMPVGIVDVVSVSVGAAHVLAKRSDGTLFAWGNNGWNGQSNVPATLGAVLDYAAGNLHSLAVKANGSVVAWGYNGNGQCTVPAAASSNVVKVAGGFTHSLALKNDGTVLGWGASSDGQIAVSGLTNVVDIAAGDRFSAFLKSDGTVVCMGLNDNAQSTVPAGLTDVVDIVCNRWNTIALKSDGTVVVWGNNSYGQRTVPAGLSNVVQIAADSYRTAALKADGSLVIFGNATMPLKPPGFTTGVIAAAVTSSSLIGLKPDGTLSYWSAGATPSIISGATNVAKVVAGDSITVLLKNNGSVTTSTGTVPAGTVAIDVAAGQTHGLAVKTDGTVVAWGGNTSGQTSVPAGLTDVVQVAAGRSHSLALKSDGTVVAWGLNDSGQATVPAGLANVVAIAAGYDNSIALKSDGTVTVWGSNNSQQLTVPAAATGLTTVTAGQMFYGAVRSDGAAVKWGHTVGGASSSLGGVTCVAKMQGGMSGTAVLQHVYLDLSVASMYDHQTVTGTLTLPVAPGVGGADVTIATTDVNVSAIGTVHVPEGSNTATFALTSSGVDSDKVVYVTATYNGHTSYAAITVYKSPNRLSSLTLSKSDVVGLFENVTGTVNLVGNATENVTVALSSSNASAASVPATVLVPAGQSSVDFQITTYGVQSAASVTISATFAGSVTAGLTVQPLPLSAININPTQVSGSQPAIGQLVLSSAPATDVQITIASSVPAAAWVPDPVTVLAGETSATFPIATALVGSDTNVVFTAAGLSSPAGTLIVRKVNATAVTINPGTVVGGQSATGRVSIGGVLLQNVTLPLQSSDTDKATVPASVVITAGQTYADFTITTHTVLAVDTVEISSGAAIENLTVTPPALSTIALPESMYGMQQVTGTVSLTHPAKDGYTVSLSSGSEGLSVPSSVTFAEGATTATFIATSADVATKGAIPVTATGFGGPKVDSIAVRPNLVRTFTVSPAQVMGGSSAVVTGRVTLTAPPYADTPVAIGKTPNIGAVGVPSSVMVGPSGVATFPITHEVVGDWTSVVITATKAGATKGAGLVLSPNMVASISVKPKTIVGGSNRVVTGSVSLTYPVARDTQIDLISTDPSAASVPAQVTILAGQKTATFTVSHSDVAARVHLQIAATKGGLTVFAPLSVTPNRVVAHTINPTTVVGGSGEEVYGVVTLEAPVAVDTVVMLSGTYPAAATVPASVTIPAGEISRAYPVTTSATPVVRDVRITATKIGSARKVELKVTPS